MKYSPKQALGTIKLIHISLMGGIVFFSIVIVFLNFDGTIASEPIKEIEYVPIFLFLLALPSSNMMYKQALKKVNTIKELKAKMTLFQTAHIIRMAILEACALFAAVVAFINGNLYHLIIPGLIVALFASKIPSVTMLESDVQLSREEKEKFTHLG